MVDEACIKHDVIRVRRYLGDGVWELGSLREYLRYTVVMLVDPEGIDWLTARPRIIRYEDLEAAESWGWVLELD